MSIVEIPEFEFVIDLQGESLYTKWLELGNVGEWADFLEWLKIKGDSAYQVWLDLGYEGTEEDFMTFLQNPASEAGVTAVQAMQIAVAAKDTAVAAKDVSVQKAIDAGTSEQNAAGSALAAKASEDAAKISETAAGQSESGALSSQQAAEAAKTAATTQAGIATTKAGEALTSAQNAATSEQNALASKNAAKVSEDAAKLSETNAGNSELAAGQAKTASEAARDLAVAANNAAQLAKTAAETAETNSETAKVLAQKYAENPEDVEVVAGEYSAKHWAAKSEYFFDNLSSNWVGVVIDPTLSSSEPAPKSTVTAYRATELARTGNLYYHKFGNSRIFNAFQLAIVNRATRKVAWYLNKNNPSLRADGTTSTPDWTTQNIAVIVPNLYRRIKVLDELTGKYEVAYDIAPFDGAQLWHEESAHSPGFASMDRTLTQLVSVVSDDARFRGGANESTKDLLPSTQLGRPATNISRINFENYAAAAGWETGNIADRTMWHELTALYFANTNIQLAYTTTLTAEGYPQGGLGSGVANWNSSRWSMRNGYYPIHKVGEGFMTLGCNTGVKSMTEEKYYVGAISSVSAGNLVSTGQFTTGAGWSASYIGYTVQNLQTLAEATITGKTDDNTLTLSDDIFQTSGQWYWIKGVTYSYEIPVFFGLEHLYGEIWDWVSGVNIEVSANVENGGTGESKAYVCTDFSKRAATITADYKYIGLTPRADNWIKELYRDFAIAKVNTGAGSATFMSDYGYYGNLPSSGSVVRGLLFGALAFSGANAGVRCSNANSVPAGTSATFGARLRAKIEK